MTTCECGTGISKTTCGMCGTDVCKKCSNKQKFVWLPAVIFFFPIAPFVLMMKVYCPDCKQLKDKKSENVDKALTWVTVKLVGWIVGGVLATIIVSKLV